MRLAPCLALLLLALPAPGHPIDKPDRAAASQRRQTLRVTLARDYALLLAQPFSGVSQPRQEGDYLYLTAVR